MRVYYGFNFVYDYYTMPHTGLPFSNSQMEKYNGFERYGIKQ